MRVAALCLIIVRATKTGAAVISTPFRQQFVRKSIQRSNASFNPALVMLSKAEQIE